METNENKNKTSNVVDELRKNLYQLHGYECPEEPLYMNENAVAINKQSAKDIEKSIQYIENNPEKYIGVKKAFAFNFLNLAIPKLRTKTINNKGVVINKYKVI